VNLSYGIGIMKAINKYKYVILGGGPAGLTFANKLKQAGENSFLVVEKEDEAGGLCRSKMVDGAPMDIGGGHFLDVSRKDVNQFLFGFMPENEWNIFNRDSRIEVEGHTINHPFESNIWQFPTYEQIDYLKSIAVAGCNLNQPMPEKFIDWIDWKLGKEISDKYMIPYNKKMFGNELNELGTYWLEKLPNVSFDETLLSCLEKKPYGSQPGHAKFYYPKQYGYGELWLRMADAISDHIIYNSAAIEIDFINHMITLQDESQMYAEKIINTVPWNSFNDLIGMPDEISDNIKELKNTSIYTTYCSESMNTKAHWIYYPNLEVPYHRILVRENFCTNSKGYWTETNSDRFVHDEEKELHTYFSQYAYPLNTRNKPIAIGKILEWAKQFEVYGLGRWGEHSHYNSDVTVAKAIELANTFIKKEVL